MHKHPYSIPKAQILYPRSQTTDPALKNIINPNPKSFNNTRATNNKTTTMKLPSLTPKQAAVLVLLYRYRFLNIR